MASATGIPDRNPAVDDAHAGESQPLLGQPGDVLQKPDEPMYKNLYSGTGWLAQAGAILLVAYVWTSVFSNPPFIPLFSPHPLLQTLGVLAVTEAILILQPTGATPESKIQGARAHAALQLLSLLLFAAGVLLIEANKIKQGPDSHFHSVHGYLGVAVSIVLVVQYVVGFAMWAVPGVFGGEDNAKKVWKYHRMSGYVLYALLLATVLSAVYTDFNVNVLDLQLWAVSVSVALIVFGVYPRLHLRKFGLNIGRKE
ncbi:unnamed protein product [Discula destructiva]